MVPQRQRCTQYDTYTLYKQIAGNDSLNATATGQTNEKCAPFMHWQEQIVRPHRRLNNKTNILCPMNFDSLRPLNSQFNPPTILIIISLLYYISTRFDLLCCERECMYCVEYFQRLHVDEVAIQPKKKTTRYSRSHVRSNSEFSMPPIAVAATYKI